MNTIIEKLAEQRQMLVDIVRQIDVALRALSGGANSSQNGGDGRREHWSKRATPAQIAAWMRNVQRTKRRNARIARRNAFKAEAEAAARERQGITGL